MSSTAWWSFSVCCHRTGSRKQARWRVRLDELHVDNPDARSERRFPLYQSTVALKRPLDRLARSRKRGDAGQRQSTGDLCLHAKPSREIEAAFICRYDRTRAFVSGADGAPPRRGLDGGAHIFLDVRSVSFSGRTVSLHHGRGVPLTGLGAGSSRLLVAGLQRETVS